MAAPRIPVALFRPSTMPTLVLLAALLVGCSDDDTGHRPGSSLASDDRGPRSVERLRDAALHTTHATAKEPVPCDGCHELVAGQYLQAASWRCEKCHPDQHVALHASASVDSGARGCWSCHDFTTASNEPAACLSCHDQPLGPLPAITPHDPAHPEEDCGDCHRAHQEPSRLSTACEGCHEEPVSGHTKPGIQITGCGSCHGFHEPAATASARCTNCHRQSHQEVSFKATFAGGHVACTTCHRPHRFEKSEVVGCRDECHEQRVALAESKVEKHRGCIGCHDNHDVRGGPELACSGCHARIAPRHPKDRASGSRCVGCHKPHLGAEAPIAVACSKCHSTAGSDRGFHQGAGQRGPACRDCHRPHGFAKRDVDRSFCLGCHGDHPFKNAKPIETFVAHADCFGCHGDTVAHAPAGKRAACISCHKEKAAIRKEHEDCVQCHDPHTTRQQRPCGACHTDEAGKARKDHQNCVRCHEPHGTQVKKSCAECHAAEASTAPTGHQPCMSCHDQHSTLVTRPCEDCHADRAAGVHAPVPGGCLACHRPHGPDGKASPPVCTSCHDSTRLPLLHQVPAHQQCTTCHRSHGEQPNRKRASCVACHKDRTTHEPTAAMCFGCHPFGGAP